MAGLRGDDFDSLQRSLRHALRSGQGGDVALSLPQVRLLLDELGRLQQSSDRLRRQNRRARLRRFAAEGEGGGDAAAPPPPEAP